MQQEEELQINDLMQVDQQNAVTAISVDEVFGGHELAAIDTTLTNEEYVNFCIKRASKFFNTEAGNNEAKR